MELVVNKKTKPKIKFLMNTFALTVIVLEIFNENTYFSGKFKKI